MVAYQNGKKDGDTTVVLQLKKMNFFNLLVTADSQSRFLTADSNNHCIQIMELVCYVDNGDLKHPCGLCVNYNNNFFVGEFAMKRKSNI